VSRNLLTQHAIVCGLCKYNPCNPLFKQKSTAALFEDIFSGDGGKWGAAWSGTGLANSFRHFFLSISPSLSLYLSHYYPPSTLLHRNFFMSAKALMPLLFLGRAKKTQMLLSTTQNAALPRGLTLRRRGIFSTTTRPQINV
jgi:hypothetical protein